ncbi:MAG: phosphoribosyl-AMP cyclohydrolase [Alphaproteobacteria bacterium]
MSKSDIEESLSFTPKYDEKGLIPCVATCDKTGDVLMFAFMNEEALNKTIETGEAHYWSRSRKSLWHKGATSGHIQKIVEIRTDCDQDCIWLKIDTDHGSCHTGRKSCFYRVLDDNSKVKLSLVDDKKLFDPDDVYKN